MGGHGGLNILPQKKWNVYNHDNRAIVDRDKKLAEQKRKTKYQKDREDRLSGKIQTLKQQNGIIDKQQQKFKDEPLVNHLNAQFKKLNQKTHINLFERQQKIIENQQILQIKKLQQAEFLKDKNMDYSSKFLGTYADKNKKAPWYARQKGYVESKPKYQQIQQMLSVKKSDSHTLNQVIKIEKKHQDHEQSQFQRSREKKKDQNKKSEIDLLRQKRLKRQQKQRQKALKIKGQRFNS